MSGIATPWSRRRAAVAAEAAAEERAAQDAAVREKQAALAEKTDSEILEELGLADPESLGLGDDFKGFMSKAVPEHIRKRALRKLWRSNPVLACMDGLNDYDDDYLTGSFGQGAISTTYQVGKGMLAHLLEDEGDKDAATASAPSQEIGAHAGEPEPAVPDDGDIEMADRPDMRMADIPQAVAPRRMQFQFKDDTA